MVWTKEMDSILLSIIIPVYNPNLYDFRKCIDSITGIEMPMEVIVIDDGSQLKNVQPCLDYTIKDKRISWVRKENGGVSSARNYGIRKARGKYLLFVDADDGLTEVFVKFINQKFNLLSADWVLFDVIEYHKNTDDEITRVLLSEKDRPSDETNNIYNINFEDVLELRINSRKLAECWGKFISRRLVVENNVDFPEGVLSGEDVIFNTRLLCCLDKVQYVPLNAYVYNYIPKMGGRLLADPYKRYHYFTVGKMELERLINNRADFRKKNDYLILQKVQYIEFVIQDCFILFKAEKLDEKMKHFLEGWIQDNEILNGISLKVCHGIKQKIYYLILKYRLWCMVGIISKIKNILNK